LLDNPIVEAQYWFSRFYQLTTDAHAKAIQRDATLYVASETFIGDLEGETWMFTAFAVLRDQYDVARNPSISSSWSPEDDLVFHYIRVPTTDSPDQLDDWLDGQTLVKHINSTGAMSAIWDLSRLPAGPHHPSSTTFRYLMRSFQTVETR
jgi:hypothetical protein